MATSELVTIPARRGTAARVGAGQHIRVINMQGTQVVDTWAFIARPMFAQWMAMEASRAWFMKLAAAAGDSFLTNRRRPILTLVEDTWGGAHDTLMALLRPPALPPARRRGPSRQLPRQSARRARRAGPRDPGHAVAAESVHEHSVDARGAARLGRAGLDAGELRALPRRDGSRGRVLRLPPRHLPINGAPARPPRRTSASSSARRERGHGSGSMARGDCPVRLVGIRRARCGVCLGRARAPGSVVVLRHSFAPGGFDPPDARLDDCSTQRNLDERGRAQARRIGDAFRQNGVAVGAVLSSPRCRCLDTARLAFGQAQPWDPLQGALNDTASVSARSPRSRKPLPDTGVDRRWYW